MPHIFDNIEQPLLPALSQTMQVVPPRRFLRRVLQPPGLEAGRRLR